MKLWSYHLQFMPFEQVDVSAPDENLRLQSVARLGEQMRKAAAIGIDKFVIHPSGEPIEEDERAKHMAQAQKSLAALAAAADALGGVLCVEDLPRSCLGRDSSDVLQLLEADSRLRVCFDTNHLLTENPVDFCRAMGDKIATVHISDYDNINERHWLCGEGCIDWRALYDELSKRYNGVWTYEIGAQCPSTLFRDRDLEPGDYVKNAKEVFAGQKPTRFSTPKPNLGMWE